MSRAVVFRLEHVSEWPGGVAGISAAGLHSFSAEVWGRALKLALLTSVRVLLQLSREPRSEVLP